MQKFNTNYYSDDPEDLNQEPKKQKLPALFAFLLLLVGGTYFVQTTLAANISLNTGAPVEFGQGITQTVACSGATNLTITPNSTFTNSSGGGAFNFSSVTVSNIPAGCNGKDFTIRAFGNTSSTPLALFNSTSTNTVVWNDGGTFKLGAGSTTGASITSGSETFTVTFTTPVALATTVFKITMESGAHTEFFDIGSTGPGGGIVFYYSAAGFNCGLAFSATGSPTGGKCNYLEAAAKTWSGGSSDGTGRWCSDDQRSVAGTLTTIGSGAANTKVMKDGCLGTTIATTISSLSLGGKSDWYIPSQNEAIEFYTQRTLFTGTYALSGNGTTDTDPARYLTSTQSSTNLASNFMYVKWFNGVAENGWKAFNGWSVRPIRAF